MSKTLHGIAKAINAEFPELEASVAKSWSSTDTKIPGTRLRRPGNGRSGLKLTVKARTAFSLSKPLSAWGETEFTAGDVVFTHDSSQTYRTNSEAIEIVDRFRANRIATDANEGREG